MEVTRPTDSESNGSISGTKDLQVSEDGAEECLARSRDRNREHARKTRLRKKVHLQSLQKRVKDLQDENRMLRQTLEECSIASILLGLSSGDSNDKQGTENEVSTNSKTNITERTFFTVSGKRKRFVSDAGDSAPRPMQLNIKGIATIVGGSGSKAHINWKTGVFVNEDGSQHQLFHDELEALRRERNRMHAKMTRDRKKIFINNVEKTIAELEADNKRMKSTIARQALNQSTVTPEPSPVITAVGASHVRSVPPLKALESPRISAEMIMVPTKINMSTSKFGELSIIG